MEDIKPWETSELTVVLLCMLSTNKAIPVFSCVLMLASNNLSVVDTI